MSAPEYHAASAASAAAFHGDRVARAFGVRRARRIRRVAAAAVLLALALYSVAGFVGVPTVVRRVVAPRIAAALDRPLSVGRVAFNPYTLRLSIDRIRLDERGGVPTLLSIAGLRVRLSWRSLLRLAPIVSELTIDRPVLHVVRTAANRLNVSDLFESSRAGRTWTGARRPGAFAISNFELRDGEIDFDDAVLGQKHRIDRIAFSVPYVASPSSEAAATDVRPELRMTVDGSPVELSGTARPFATPPESAMELRVRRLDLARFAGYVPKTAAANVGAGTLSADLRIRFTGAAERPLIRLSGEASLNQLAVRDRAGAPLGELREATIALAEVEPLEGIARLGDVRIDGLKLRAIRNRAGAVNLTSLMRAGARPAAQRPSRFDLALKSLALTDGAIQFTDETGAAPAKLALGGIRFEVRNLATNAQAPPAPFTLAATLGTGGALAATGSLDAARLQASGDFSLKQVELPPLQRFAQSTLAGSVASGKLSARARARTRIAGGRLEVRVEPAETTIDNFEMRAPDGGQSPLRWSRLSVELAEADLAARRAAITRVRADGLYLRARRERNGELNLASLVRRPPASAEPWSYRIGSVDLENARLSIEDASAPAAPVFAAGPLSLHMKDVSSDFAKPIAVEAEGKLNRGTLKASGSATLAPLDAEIRIVARRIDLSPLTPYLSDRLNVAVKKAALTVNGVLAAAESGGRIRTKFRGDAALSGVRMLDGRTRETFLVWNLLTARRIEFDAGAAPTRLRVGALGLSNFFARMVLSREGRLNLSEIVARSWSELAPAQGVSDVEFGEVSFERGTINYTDNFIQPNFRANLTGVSGRIGAFGTRSATPADVTLRGEIDRSAPIDVRGSINPLAPMASVDLRARAENVELPNLSSYSTRYTGYPITRGTLSADVHYLLERETLTAENHIFVDQLTFGDRVESAGALNLPVRMAVALLKDSRGQINLNVPVSGSLSDPQFSISSVVWQAFVKAIRDATNSPFKMLAAAVGGEGGGGEAAEGDYDHIDFAPGSATLSATARSRLDTLGRALRDRPGVRLAVTGRVDPNFDREGLREARLMDAIREQKIKDLGAPAAGADPATIRVAPDEYGKYLWRAYKAADFQKPSNLIGMTTLLPQDEMRKLMLEHISVTDHDLRRLAEARAEAVRNALAANAGPGRIFVAAPALSAEGVARGKTTRVDLALQ